MKINRLILFLLTLVFFNSCMDDAAWYEMNDLDVKYDTLLNSYIAKQTGLFIVNEGNFMYDNASLSYYLIDSMKVLNNVFYRTNQTPLGDVAQSMTVRDSLGYIVINNSSKIYVININTFEYVGKITGLTSPRHIHFINDEKAYVTDLYAKAIAIVNPKKFEISGYIDVSNPASVFNQHATEQMLQFENYVFSNCWSFDNTILVIDTDTDLVVDSINVPLQPNSMVIDVNNRLWVLCDGGFEGNPAGNEKAALVCIDLSSFEIEKTITFGLNDHPIELCSNGMKDTLYYINKDIYQYSVNSHDLPEMLIESPYSDNLTGGYYGLGVDPYYGDLYVADAIDQIQRGIVYRYKSDGTVVDTFKTGISPGAFCFK